MRYIAWIFFAIFAFVGCATEMSLEAQRVAILNEVPKDCALLGVESGNALDASGVMSIEGLKQAAINDLKVKVAELRGDSAYILDMQPLWNDAMGGYEYQIKSNVYKCVKESDLGENKGDSNESKTESTENKVDSTQQ